MVLELRIDVPVRFGQRNPQLHTVQYRPALGRRLLRVRDAAACRHQTQLARSYRLVAAQAVTV